MCAKFIFARFHLHTCLFLLTQSWINLRFILHFIISSRILFNFYYFIANIKTNIYPFFHINSYLLRVAWEWVSVFNEYLRLSKWILKLLRSLLCHIHVQDTKCNYVITCCEWRRQSFYERPDRDVFMLVSVDWQGWYD